jgi:hypothetical protein
LTEYILACRPKQIDPWVDEPTYRLVADAADRLGSHPLKPIFEALGGQVPYDVIRLVTTHLEVRE